MDVMIRRARPDPPTQLTHYHRSPQEQSFNVSEKTDVLEAFLMEAIDTYTQWFHLHEERCRQRDASLDTEFPFHPCATVSQK